jgi:hypothetical protein
MAKKAQKEKIDMPNFAKKDKAPKYKGMLGFNKKNLKRSVAGLVVTGVVAGSIALLGPNHKVTTPPNLQPRKVNPLQTESLTFEEYYEYIELMDEVLNEGRVFDLTEVSLEEQIHTLIIERQRAKPMSKRSNMLKTKFVTQ